MKSDQAGGDAKAMQAPTSKSAEESGPSTILLVLSLPTNGEPTALRMQQARKENFAIFDRGRPLKPHFTEGHPK